MSIGLALLAIVALAALGGGGGAPSKKKPPPTPAPAPTPTPLPEPSPTPTPSIPPVSVPELPPVPADGVSATDVHNDFVGTASIAPDGSILELSVSKSNGDYDALELNLKPLLGDATGTTMLSGLLAVSRDGVAQTKPFKLDMPIALFDAMCFNVNEITKPTDFIVRIEGLRSCVGSHARAVIGVDTKTDRLEAGIIWGHADHPQKGTWAAPDLAVRLSALVQDNFDVPALT